MSKEFNIPLIHQFKKLVERLKSIDRSPSELTQGSSPDSTLKKHEELFIETSQSQNLSVSEGPLAQIIPVRDFKVHFTSHTLPAPSFKELVQYGQIAESVNLLKANPLLISEAFFEACLSNNAQLCKALLDKKKFGQLAANPNEKNSYGKTALHLAAAEGYIIICEILLDYSETLNINPTDNEQKTPLHLACIYNEVKIAQLLIRSKALINLKDSLGNTPLHYASINSNHELVEWLIAKNADINIKNNKGQLASEVHKEVQVSIGDEKSEPFFQSEPLSFERMIKKINKYLIQPFAKLKITAADYKPLAVLGKGSFGEVFLVRKHGGIQQFAMKILKKTQLIAQRLIPYALTERNIMITINHPFIVRLINAFQSKSKLYLILDYCAGGTLKNYLNKGCRFSESRSRPYICETILALEELHRNNIIYRDLKPENIGIDQKGHIMLFDFGLSKEDVNETSSAYSFCGSVKYLAPEILRRAGHGKAVDWYLLGVLLYEMVCGVVPYHSNKHQEMFQNILYGKLDIPSDLSAECKDLLVKLLEKNPEYRLGSRCAAEIKRHPFFRGVDWAAVLRKEMHVEMPSVRANVNESLPQELILDFETDFHPNVQGWTFLRDSNLE